MISVTGKKWVEKKININSVEKIKQDYNFSETLSKLLITRNFSQSEIYTIDNRLDLKNIFLKNQDFIDGVKLIINSINNKEIVCIVGDYDVDGSVATSFFVRLFTSINQPFFFYIPDRVNDGYGVSIKLFEKLIIKKPSLVIMVDCGSTSNEAINFLNKKKIKSLVIDHHEINKPFPKANVIINPKKNNGYKDYDYFCATTLTFFLIDLLIKHINCKFKINSYLLHVLLATVCDVMPLRNFNRLISINALKNTDINKIKFLKEIFQLNKKRNKINIDDLGFLIGPILNAGGRLGKSNYATELLSTDNQLLLNKRTKQLIKLNNQRKKIEEEIINKINFSKIEKENHNIIIYYHPNINEGLIGIIAARLKDYFNKTSIVITSSGNLLKGSARSNINYNIGHVIKKTLDKGIILNGGGHNMAAGFSLKKNKLKLFESFLNKDFSSKKKSDKNFFTYDSEILFSAINKEFYNNIKKIEPFGEGNPHPTFLFKNLKVIKVNILKKKHILSILKFKNGNSINSMAFNSLNTKVGEHLLNYKRNISVIAQIKENFWNNKNSLQLIIKDIFI